MMGRSVYARSGNRLSGNRYEWTPRQSITAAVSARASGVSDPRELATVQAELGHDPARHALMAKPSEKDLLVTAKARFKQGEDAYEKQTLRELEDIQVYNGDQ